MIAVTAAHKPLTSRELNSKPLSLRTAFTREKMNVEERTVELAFSSELPYERWFGIEILDHGAAAVDLSRMTDGAALLLNHDSRSQIGVVERAWIDGDRKCRAIVRFSRGVLGEEIWQDVQDGIRRLVSVGYSINEAVLEKHDGKTGMDTYRVTSWTPHEVSIVAVPADPSVGIGRAASERPTVPQTKEIPVDENDIATRTAAPAAQPAAAAAQAAVDIRVLHAEAILAARNAEQERIRNIRALGEQHEMRELAGNAINEGTTLEQFRATVLDKLVAARKIKPAESAEVGLSSTELSRFSIRKLIAALQFPGADTLRDAAFEIEVSQAARGKRPVEDTDPRRAERSAGYAIPIDVLRTPMGMSNNAMAARQAAEVLYRAMRGQRDLVVGTASAGGNLVQTDLLSANFIEMLRAAMITSTMGARMLTDLNGNVAIPSQTGGALAYWVAENVAITESQATFGQVTMTPKTVGLFTDYSRRLLLQSSLDIEMLVRMDLVNGLAVEVDRAALNGSGTGGQPFGVLNVAGIGAVAGGANGAAPTWDNIVDLESAVANVNADTGSLGYVTNTRVRGRLKRTQRFTGTNGDPIWEKDKTVNGYTTGITNNVPNTLTKGTSTGVCSAILFGNWSDLLIGTWSGIDLILDPYTGSSAGTKRVVALQDVDVAVRRVASFAAMADALTV